MKDSPQYRSFAWVICVVIASCMGTLTYSFQMTSLADSLKSLIILFRIPQQQKYIIQAVLTASVNFGALLGCLFSLYAIRFSYRKTIILLDCLLIIGSLFEMSQSLYLFIAGRVIAGFGGGLHSVIVPLFIKLIAPKQLYGTMATIIQAMFAIGYMLTSVAGLYLETPEDATYHDLNLQLLRYYFLVPSIFSMIRLILMVTWVRFDPPFFHLINSSEAKAAQIVDKIYKDEFHSEVLSNYRNQLEKKNQEITLFSSSYRVRFLLAVYLNVMQQFNGQPAVVHYSTLIFLDATNERVALFLTLGISISKSIFYSLGSSFQQRLGRRIPYLIGNGIMATAMIGIAYVSHLLEKNTFPDSDQLIRYLLIGLIFLFLFANFNSVGFIGSIYIPELVPDRGVSYSSIAYWISSILTLLCFPTVKGWFGMSWCFAGFGINCWIAEYVMYKYGLETVNKNETQIDEMFENLRNGHGVNYAQVSQPQGLLTENSDE